MKILLGSLLAALLLLALILFRATEVGKGIGPETPPQEPTHSERPARFPLPDDARSQARPVLDHQPATATRSTSQGCTIVATLKRQDGSVLTQGEIALYQDRRAVRTIRVDAGGQASFSVDPGRYELRATPESLPTGMLPPFWQGQSTRSGFHATKIEVGAGQTREVELFVLLAASVSGYVYGPEGEPVQGAFVRFQCFEGGLAGLCADASTDTTGRYEISALYPGPYQTQIFFAAEHPYHDVSRPLPKEHRIEEGVALAVDFLLGMGSAGIRGRVVDQFGQPFSDLHVLCHYFIPREEYQNGGVFFDWGDVAGETRTTETGAFVLSGIPPARVALVIDPYGWLPSNKIGGNRLGVPIRPLILDFRGSSGVEHDAGTIAAYRSRPFRVEGTVLLDSAWASRVGMSLRDLEMELIVPAHEARNFHPTGEPFDVKTEIKIDRNDGSFSLGCETPQDSVTVRVTCPRVKADAVEVVLSPIPDTTLELLIAFPR